MTGQAREEEEEEEEKEFTKIDLCKMQQMVLPSSGKRITNCRSH